MQHRLRLFTGEESTQLEETPQISVRLRDITRALQDAARWDRTWLSDFADDEVQISTDLYDILSAYIHMRPGA